MHGAERPRKRLAFFTALDLDRTIFNSTVFFEGSVLPAIRGMYSADSLAVDQIIDSVKQQEAQMRGQTFDFISAINNLLAAENMPIIDAAELSDAIIEKHRDESGRVSQEYVDRILADCALELIELLEQESSSAWGILTTGGEKTQSLKLSVLTSILLDRLDIETQAQIINTEQKSQMVHNEWLQPDGVYRIPDQLSGFGGVLSERVRVIDDKKRNLTLHCDLPHEHRIYPYHVVRSDDPHPVASSQRLTLRQVIDAIQPVN